MSPLTAEVAILAFPHIWRKVLPDSTPFGVDDPCFLQAADCFFGALHPRRIVGIFLRFLILKSWDRNRFHFFNYSRKPFRSLTSLATAAARDGP